MSRGKQIQHHVPKGERDKKFCAAWLEHFDATRAWGEAGYSLGSKNAPRRALAKLQRFAAYLKPLQEAKAQQVGTQLAMTQGDVLETMRAMAYANIQDYYRESTEPMLEKHTAADGTVTLVPVTFQGKPVMKMEPVPLMQLTRQQALAVEPFYIFGRLVGYKLLSSKTRHQYLHSLGQNLGLWMDEIVRENHTHFHRHAHLHLDHVPSEKIARARNELIGVVGADFARSLGFTAEELAQATEVPALEAPTS